MLFLSVFLALAGSMQSADAAGGLVPKDADPVIVVGGGLAGLSAVIEALEHGAKKVILLDKEKDVGGNSAKATSGINAWGTPAQDHAGIKDSADLFYTDTMNAGDRENDPALVDTLVHNSPAAVEFLVEKGVDLSEINLCGGHSVPRTHWLPVPREGKPLPVGVAIIRALKTHLKTFQEQNPERLEIRTEVEVVGLVTWNEYVTGVRYRSASNRSIVEELAGKAVVLSSGGFSADRGRAGAPAGSEQPSLLAQHAPQLARLPTTNGAFATGDGVKMAAAMGAAVVGLDHVQVHPTAFVDPKDPSAGTKFLAAEALRGKGALLVNEKGARFANELGRRDYLSKKINDHCARWKEAGDLPITYMLMNDQIVDAFGRPSFNFYAKIKGFFQEYANVEALKDVFDLSTIKATLEEHNQNVDKAAKTPNFKDSFGKHIFPAKFDLAKPIYVAKITPAIHYTMGGLKIDRNAFVFSEFMQKPFKGLLAAGEVSGGVHGRNRLAGNSLLECVVFGRISGRSAALLSYQGREEL